MRWTRRPGIDLGQWLLNRSVPVIAVVMSLKVSFMLRPLTIIVALTLLLDGNFAFGQLLTCGSPAPEFTPEGTLRGDEIQSLQHDRKYVLEFSGTQCAPCIKSIPHIEKLKAKHSDFTFVTVFVEEKEQVDRFLKNAGRQITSTVVYDATGRTGRSWLARSGFPGIPQVLVVNDDGNISWIGHPDRLEPVLQILGSQDTVSSTELARIELKQHAYIRSLRFDEFQKYRTETIIPLINKGRHAEAIEKMDETMRKYFDMPDVIRELRRFKLSQMAYTPDSHEVARNLAFDLAADADNHENSEIASTLVFHYTKALPENKDKDFVRWALALLNEMGPRKSSDTDEQLMLRRNHYSTLAGAHRILGNSDDAKQALDRAIQYGQELVTTLKQREDHPLNIKAAENVLQRMKKRKEETTGSVGASD
ncbi:TlpA family protein disulfide reductase [Rubripirellula reticaptiva]|uniref:Thiol-disulfide oxidoreductase n=1 Tax=Rubripirellula reticaptiva TaxID=2528013 RepID=A0A5C6EX49_9BACT|nr:TlpA disulfide reductase family protein [Rubripirellula reticaptiva]TWU52039.1 thiol-disulfide oxidoreductase [Rubripirellula reticaptiva]